MNQSLTERYPRLIRNILAGIIILLILIFVPGRMVWHLRDQYLSQANAANAQTQVLKTKIDEAQQVQHHPQQFTQRLQGVQAQLPPELTLPTLINELQTVCQQNGVQLTQVTPPQGGQVVVAGSGQTVNPEAITLSVQGPLAALEQLDSALQSQTQLFSITQVNTSTGGSQGQDSQNIGMDAFLWNPSSTS
jgi:Tfp pilus assembly protein PilO